MKLLENVKEEKEKKIFIEDQLVTESLMKRSPGNNEKLESECKPYTIKTRQ